MMLRFVLTLAKMKRVLVISLILIAAAHLATAEAQLATGDGDYIDDNDDYIDLFGSTTPKPEVEHITTPPPFWMSDNQDDQADIMLKRELFAVYKMMFPAILVTFGAINGLCLCIPLVVYLAIIIKDLEMNLPQEAGTTLMTIRVD